MTEQFKIRDMRKKEKYFIDDAYLNGYAKLCGVYATAIYNSLSRHANFHSQTCFPAITTMAKQHGISKRSAIRATKILEKWHIIKIIKEKDEKTKRQLNNTYLLLDKSEWLSKPQKESQVPDTHPEIGVHTSPMPSASQSKTRVPKMDCNVNKGIKDNKEKDIATQSVADTTIPELIKEFETINPASKRFYVNTTQRQACEDLIKEYGFERVKTVIQKTLPKTNTIPYFPTIITPVQLRDKWASLESAINKKRSEGNKNGIASIKQ